MCTTECQNVYANKKLRFSICAIIGEQVRSMNRPACRTTVQYLTFTLLFDHHHRVLHIAVSIMITVKVT